MYLLSEEIYGPDFKKKHIPKGKGVESLTPVPKYLIAFSFTF